jgi:Ca2+-binding RTX toxin-like protein
VIVGPEFNDRIYALAGNDTVNGGLGDDSIFGCRGADKLDGGEGVDFILGGDCDDILDLRDTTVVPTDSYEYADGGNGNDTIYADDDHIDLISCGAGKKDAVTYDQYDLFVDPATGEPTGSPTADCEKATLVNR